MVTLILGRRMLRDDEFLPWVAYVRTHISKACGFEVAVETRDARDAVQTDMVVGFAHAGQARTATQAKVTLWVAWVLENKKAPDPQGAGGYGRPRNVDGWVKRGAPSGGTP